MNIQLNNKEYPIKLDFNVFKEFEAITGKSVFDFENIRTATGMIALTYCGIKAANDKTKITMQDVGESMTLEIITNVTNEYSRAMGFDLEKKE